MIIKYILTDDGAVVACPDSEAWNRWFETANRTIALAQIDGAEVSTVFLGIDHGFGADVPVLFETMIFAPSVDDGDTLDYQASYASLDEALAGHERAVAWAKLAMESIVERLS